MYQEFLVNVELGKEPEYFFIRNVDFNLRDKVATESSKHLMNLGMAGGGFNSVVGGSSTSAGNNYGFSMNSYTNPYNVNKQGEDTDEEMPVAYSHIVHVTRSQGMDGVWPFGRSILDPVFKPFRQKRINGRSYYYLQGSTVTGAVDI